MGQMEENGIYARDDENEFMFVVGGSLNLGPDFWFLTQVQQG
jgi:hypothetical protein